MVVVVVVFSFSHRNGSDHVMAQASTGPELQAVGASAPVLRGQDPQRCRV